MTDSPLAPLVRTQTALQELWRQLMGPWGFGGHSVWMMVIVEDRPLPQLTEITESDVPPDAETLAGLAGVLTRLAVGRPADLRFAFLRSRPGPDRVTAEDRLWAQGLYDACRTAQVRSEIVHLATRDAVRPLPPDELIGVASA